jgi:hypothetical protein
MKILTASEMREVDRLTTEQFGIPSTTLMENAGAAVAHFVLREFPEHNRITVLCGKGNNGGDGFVAARHLAEAGRAVAVVLLGNPADSKRATPKRCSPASVGSLSCSQTKPTSTTSRSSTYSKRPTSSSTQSSAPDSGRLCAESPPRSPSASIVSKLRSSRRPALRLGRRLAPTRFARSLSRRCGRHFHRTQTRPPLREHDPRRNRRRTHRLARRSHPLHNRPDLDRRIRNHHAHSASPRQQQGNVRPRPRRRRSARHRRSRRHGLPVPPFAPEPDSSPPPSPHRSCPPSPRPRSS